MWFRCFEEEISISLLSIVGSLQHLLLVSANPALDLLVGEVDARVLGHLGKPVGYHARVLPQKICEGLGLCSPQPSMRNCGCLSSLPRSFDFIVHALISLCQFVESLPEVVGDEER